MFFAFRFLHPPADGRLELDFFFVVGQGGKCRITFADLGSRVLGSRVLGYFDVLNLEESKGKLKASLAQTCNYQEPQHKSLKPKRMSNNGPLVCFWWL